VAVVLVSYGFEQDKGYKRILPTENLDLGKGYWILLNGIEEECTLSVEAVN
jgi:hypothetical protein